MALSSFTASCLHLCTMLMVSGDPKRAVTANSATRKDIRLHEDTSVTMSRMTTEVIYQTEHRPLRQEITGTRSVACQDSKPGPQGSESSTLPPRHTTPREVYPIPKWELTLGGQVLTVVTQARLLGLQIQSDLGWDAQVDSMVTKGSRRLFLLCRLRRAGLPTVDLTTVYCGYVRPLLEYAAPVWNAALTNKQAVRLERVQKRACRIVLGRQYTSYQEALRTLDLETLSDRRHNLCLNFTKKVRQSPRFCCWLPPTRGDLHGRQLRNSLQYSQARGTKRYTTSAKPMLAGLLNGL
ncbi:hypothetical protein Bbelb_094790 [Branchiostoma belcheri]|nr:hypothetical protein Bbelb_094790 [Branchiostoma belcheri]